MKERFVPQGGADGGEIGADHPGVRSGGDIGMGEDGSGLAGEDELARVAPVVEGLDPQRVAGEREGFEPGIVESEGEDAPEARQRLHAPGGERLKDSLAVASGTESHAPGGEFAAELGVVVELAVVDQREAGFAGVGVGRGEHGLRAGGRGVDHGEAAMGEGNVAAAPEPRAVGPAVLHLVAQAADRLVAQGRGSTDDGCDAQDSAHGPG